eukprot:m.251597 g.251597  ORF g.251597 m.251597 type:complete len:95 (+) comp40336_c0_seq85:852-1136(+)
MLDLHFSMVDTYFVSFKDNIPVKFVAFATDAIDLHEIQECYKGFHNRINTAGRSFLQLLINCGVLPLVFATPSITHLQFSLPYVDNCKILAGTF